MTGATGAVTHNLIHCQALYHGAKKNASFEGLAFFRCLGARRRIPTDKKKNDSGATAPGVHR